MRSALAILLLTSLTSLAGCTRLQDIQINGDRVWLLTRGGRHVYRCFDMTPPGASPQASPTVFCKDADLIDRDGRHDSRMVVK